MNLKMQVTMKVVYFARSYNSFNSNNHHRAFWMCHEIIQHTLARLWVYEYDLLSDGYVGIPSRHQRHVGQDD